MSDRGTLELVCLGTSDAFGSAGRHCAGYLVRSAAATVVLDAGPSILSCLGREGVASDSIDAIALSHLHGDHFGGVPFVLLDGTYGAVRTRPLTVIGPPGTEARVAALYRAYYERASRTPPPFPLRFHEISGDEPVEIGDLRLSAFDVVHQEEARSFGLRVAAGGRSLAYSGDTEWTADLPRNVAGADLFLCECTTLETPTPGHLNYRVLERVRGDFDCGRLVLTHLGREIRARRGEVPETLADDGLALCIGEAPSRTAGA